MDTLGLPLDYSWITYGYSWITYGLLLDTHGKHPGPVYTMMLTYSRAKRARGELHLSSSVIICHHLSSSVIIWSTSGLHLVYIWLSFQGHLIYIDSPRLKKDPTLFFYLIRINYICSVTKTNTHERFRIIIN